MGADEDKREKDLSDPDNAAGPGANSPLAIKFTHLTDLQFQH